MNDALRALSLSEKKVPSDIASPVFNEAFLKSVKKHGRVHELSLMASFKLRTKRFFEDFDKAPTMMKKGKLPLFGTRVGGRSERKELFRRAAEKASAGQKAPAAPGAGAAQGGQP
jgi:heterodisulfide reductase subunit C